MSVITLDNGVDYPAPFGTCRELFETQGKLDAVKEYRTQLREVGMSPSLMDAKLVIEKAASEGGWTLYRSPPFTHGYDGRPLDTPIEIVYPKPAEVVKTPRRNPKNIRCHQVSDAMRVVAPLLKIGKAIEKLQAYRGDARDELEQAGNHIARAYESLIADAVEVIASSSPVDAQNLLAELINPVNRKVRF